jgi:hypothetical protein
MEISFIIINIFDELKLDLENKLFRVIIILNKNAYLNTLTVIFHPFIHLLLLSLVINYPNFLNLDFHLIHLCYHFIFLSLFSSFSFSKFNFLIFHSADHFKHLLLPLNYLLHLLVSKLSINSFIFFNFLQFKAFFFYRPRTRPFQSRT